jgi:hypothetical protein
VGWVTDGLEKDGLLRDVHRRELGGVRKGMGWFLFGSN